MVQKNSEPKGRQNIKKNNKEQQSQQKADRGSGGPSAWSCRSKCLLAALPLWPSTHSFPSAVLWVFTNADTPPPDHTGPQTPVPLESAPPSAQSPRQVLIQNHCSCDFSRRSHKWRRKWQPTPLFLPGESQGRGTWWAVIYGVPQSRTRLTRFSSSSSTLA